ncbi:MAG TPA: hypothetical protein PKJ37_07900 [Acidobacteriota bacterium]|nr:hypothetical protein [Acidobacteriota bacterium]HNT17797.1 hypothetical protein [Acidobacteriota bacterium]
MKFIMQHRKLVIEKSLLGGLYFADSYTLSNCGARSPRLVAYIGGSVSEKTFRNRLRTEPTSIFKVFMRAVEASDGQVADLLVCPFPPPSMIKTDNDKQGAEEEDSEGVAVLLDSDWQTVLRRRLLSALLTELLPARNSPMPSTIGFVGFSSGAYLAVGLTLDIAGVKTVATLGGVGMAEAVRQSPREVCHGKRFAAFSTEDDPLRPNIEIFEKFMHKRDIPVEILIRPGCHDFSDYTANGLAEEAFRFALCDN